MGWNTRECNVMIVWKAIWGHSVIYEYDKDDCSYHMEWNTRECNRWGHSVIYGYDKDDYMMWNERGGNAMQWLKGMHPVGIPWHMNMMCNQLYIVTITPWHIIWCAINYI
jgi:hypothetical protein